MAMRTGHRDPKSLKSYQNLKGGEGLMQQRDVLAKADGEGVKRLWYSNADGSGGASAYRHAAPHKVLPPTIGHVSGGNVNITFNISAPNSRQ